MLAILANTLLSTIIAVSFGRLLGHSGQSKFPHLRDVVVHTLAITVRLNDVTKYASHNVRQMQELRRRVSSYIS